MFWKEIFWLSCSFWHEFYWIRLHVQTVSDSNEHSSENFLHHVPDKGEKIQHHVISRENERKRIMKLFCLWTLLIDSSIKTWYWKCCCLVHNGRIYLKLLPHQFLLNFLLSNIIQRLKENIYWTDYTSRRSYVMKFQEIWIISNHSNKSGPP